MAYSWVSVPVGWWSSIDIYTDPPAVDSTDGQVRLNAYQTYELSSSLTDEQRRPSKIRVTYSLEGSIGCTSGYQASINAAVDISGRASEYFSTGPGYSSPSASATYADSLEDNLTIVTPDYFTGMSFSVTAEVYGASPGPPPDYANGSVSVSVSGIEFYIDTGTSAIWTSFVNTIEENI